MAQKMQKVDCKYGAPMGRAAYGTPEHATEKIRVFHVAINGGGYDNGGAYWGLGKSLFCATDCDNFTHYTRAHSRLEAIALLGIEAHQIKVKPIADIRNMLERAKRGLLSEAGVTLLEKLAALGYCTEADIVGGQQCA